MKAEDYDEALAMQKSAVFRYHTGKPLGISSIF